MDRPRSPTCAFKRQKYNQAYILKNSQHKKNIERKEKVCPSLKFFFKFSLQIIGRYQGEIYRHKAIIIIMQQKLTILTLFCQIYIKFNKIFSTCFLCQISNLKFGHLKSLDEVPDCMQWKRIIYIL